MIPRKKKICKTCEVPKIIFSNGNCLDCYKKEVFLSTKKRPTIAPVSKKRIKENAEYKTIRKEFLSQHPLCQAKIKGCFYLSSQIHHKKGRTGKLFLDIEKWMAVCSSCHKHIEENPAESKLNGFSLSRT